jgi:hypothetical protein
MGAIAHVPVDVVQDVDNEAVRRTSAGEAGVADAQAVTMHNPTRAATT